MDGPISENISSKYYEPYDELTLLMKNIGNNMSFFLFKYIFPLLSHRGTHHFYI